jgi:hypothetical protein
MALRPIASLRGSVAAIALCASLGAVIAIGSSGSERLVQSGFDNALSSRDASPEAAAVKQGAASVALAQSEEFWLRNGQGRSTDVKPVAWSGQLARGDRLTISQAGEQHPRVFEVVETGPVSLDTTRLDASARGAQLLAVSCRDLARPDAPLIRLIVTEGALPFAVTRPGEKAL